MAKVFAGRKPIIPSSANEEILAMMKRGYNQDAIGQRFGVSGRTARRRMVQLMGRAKQAQDAAIFPTPAQTSEQTITEEEQGNPEPRALPSDEQSLEELEHLIADLNKKIAEANRAGESALHLQYVRAIVPLYESKRKMTPMPKQDPNEHPDMVKLGQETIQRLVKMLEQ